MGRQLSLASGSRRILKFRKLEFNLVVMASLQCYNKAIFTK